MKQWGYHYYGTDKLVAVAKATQEMVATFPDYNKIVEVTAEEATSNIEDGSLIRVVITCFGE